MQSLKYKCSSNSLCKQRHLSNATNKLDVTAHWRRYGARHSSAEWATTFHKAIKVNTINITTKITSITIHRFLCLSSNFSFHSYRFLSFSVFVLLITPSRFQIILLHFSPPSKSHITLISHCVTSTIFLHYHFSFISIFASASFQPDSSLQFFSFRIYTQFYTKWLWSNLCTPTSVFSSTHYSISRQQFTKNK